MTRAADRGASLGRVLMVAPPDDWLQQGSEWFDAFRPAGVILFRRHLPVTLEAARAAIARLHAWAAAQGRNLLVAADEEGGFVSQVRHLFPVPPSARALAWAAPPAEVRRVIKAADAGAAFLEATRLAGFKTEEALSFFGPRPALPSAAEKDYLTPWSVTVAERRYLEHFRKLLD